MAGLVGEADNLVLDRGAVARAATRQTPPIDSAFAEIVSDDAVSFLGRVGDAAGDLRHRDPVSQEAEGHGLVVCRLHLQPVPGNGATVQARGRAGLQTPHHQISGVQVGGQTRRRVLAVAARRDAQIAAMDDAVEEGAGRQHDGPGAKLSPLAGRDSDHTVAVHDQTLGRAGHQAQVGIVGQLGLHGLAIETTVDLASRAAYGGALGAVQQTELDARGVGQPAHDAVQGVDLAHQMALAQTADGRVAAHLANSFQLLGQQQGASAGPRGSGRGLAAGVSAADDDDVEGRGGGGSHGRGHSPSGPISPQPRRRCFT